ncbi:MAG: hypothetical protein HFJ17_01065 [Clostridia bacterium]|nr:hypothetical protein [Clostridia bacterium]
MDDVKSKVKWRKVLEIGIILLFISFTFIVSGFHEHWSDEAQSYLLARDNSFMEVFKYIRYEGTPALWIFVIKIFILLGGTYESLYILPIIFSTIGVAIFELKIDAPWYIKVLFPFTYFIFFQYTVVVRNYCMVFPLLMLICCIYDDRFEKPIMYSFILLILMNVSLHTLMIAGSMYFMYLKDLFINKDVRSKKNIIASILIFIFFLLTTLYIWPAKDCSFHGNGGREMWHIISEATLGSNSNIYMEIVISIIVYAILIYSCKDDFQNLQNLLILILPVALILNLITYQGWHVGIIFYVILTFIIITKIMDKDLIKYLLLSVFIVQIYWTFSSVNFDLNYKYSASKDVAEFLKNNNYQEKIVYGLGYSVTGIQPYFEKNIFKNENTEKSFYLWRYNNGYLANDEIIANKAEIYVISSLYINDYLDVVEKLEFEGYDKYQFYGNTYVKNNVNEPEGYIVYINNK